MRHLAFFLVVLSSAISVGCTDKTEPAVRSATLNEEFSIAPGEYVQIENSNLIIGHQGVIENSLCPPYFVCVWAGRLAVNLSVHGITSTMGLLHEDYPSEMEYQYMVHNYTIHLINYDWNLSDAPKEEDSIILKISMD